MMNPNQMKKLMKQMNVKELPVVKAEFHLDNGDVMVFDHPQISRVNMMGQEIFQVAGEHYLKKDDEKIEGYTNEDVELVMKEAKVSKDTAIRALEASEGDILDAVEWAKENK